MAKVFAERKISAKGLILPHSEFKLFAELESYSFNERKVKKIIQDAEHSLELDIPLLPASLYMDYKRTGNRTNYEKPYNRRRNMLLTLAYGEFFERKGRFTDKLVDVIWAILEESTWQIPAHLSQAIYGYDSILPMAFEPDKIHGTELCSSGTCANLAFVLYFCRDFLDEVSPVICKRIEYSLRQRCIDPYLYGNNWWMGFSGRRVNNWGPWVTSQTLFVTALVEKDLYTREMIVDKALRVLDNYTASLPDDGGCDEGTSYWSGAGGTYFDALEIIYDMSGGKINVFDHPFVKSIGEYIVKMNINDTQFVNFSDCGGKSNPGGNLLRRFGEKCGSEELIAFGDTMATIDDCTTSGFMYRGLRTLISPDVTPTKVKGKLKSILPSLKVMTARECEDTATGTFLAVKGGSNGESHNHNDVGSFIVYRNGNPVLIDAGNETYNSKTFSGLRYTLWFTQSYYHNLPTFGGIGQHQGAEYCSTDEEYCDTDTPSYSFELKNAYLKEAGIVSYRRKAELSGATVNVYESFTLDEAKEVDFRLLCPKEPAVLDDGRIALPEGMCLRYDTEAFVFSYEKVQLEDSAMLNRWKDGVFQLHFKTTAKEMNTIFVIEKK